MHAFACRKSKNVPIVDNFIEDVRELTVDWGEACAENLSYNV